MTDHTTPPHATGTTSGAPAPAGRARHAPRQRRLEELDVEECLHLLRTRAVGRLAYVVDGQPRILPLNFAVVEGQVVMRTEYGDTLDTLSERTAVAFEVDDIDQDYHQGWSVVVHGKAEEVWHPDELARLRAVPLRPWAPGARAHYLRISSSAITGRRIV